MTENIRTELSERMATSLDEAANLIERNGLFKGNYWPDFPIPYRGYQPCCVLGALSVVMGCAADTVCLTPVGFELHDHVTRRRGASMLTWGDAPDVTQADVVTELRDCAAVLRQPALRRVHHPRHVGAGRSHQA